MMFSACAKSLWSRFEDAYQCLMKPEVWNAPVSGPYSRNMQQVHGGLDALVATAFDSFLKMFR
jgi:hypothetical protein